jgi:hypothetical protein
MAVAVISSGIITPQLTGLRQRMTESTAGAALDPEYFVRQGIANATVSGRQYLSTYVAIIFHLSGYTPFFPNEGRGDQMTPDSDINLPHRDCRRQQY